MLDARGGLVDAVVVDLFAGSGSFGIEALSRGAAKAVFVERDRAAAEVLSGNIERLGFADRSTIVRTSVEAALPNLGPVDLAFCDPPFPDDPWLDLLDKLDAELLVGHAERPIELTDHWEEVRRRTYGRSRIVIARRLAPP
jgi:16S rRNA (guanine966-N2)-methyltransferase